ncbi:MAG: PHB depolymerase family esterase [Gammaproteobacteria bacterium]|jgi:poly(hydroxyalkanoate) depolymerase family esterase
MIRGICRALPLLLWASALAALEEPIEVTRFGSNPGNLRMLKYVPPQVSTSAPLVVVLHGCGQSAADHAAASGWIKLSMRWGLLLLLPEQKRRNNLTRCFNWFRPEDVQRGSGEVLSIRQMINQMIADHAVDQARIFVTGVSGGGAMAGALLATHPETFAGGALIAAVPYGCADGLFQGIACMRASEESSAQDWAMPVRSASDEAVSWPIISIWHGDADRIVKPANAERLVQQWTGAHGIDADADTEETISGHVRKTYQDASGRDLVEMYLIRNMGHGMPVDPGDEPDQCGEESYFFPDADICASYHIGMFWRLGR